jgi:hypothetical protein
MRICRSTVFNWRLAFALPALVVFVLLVPPSLTDVFAYLSVSEAPTDSASQSPPPAG